MAWTIHRSPLFDAAWYCRDRHYRAGATGGRFRSALHYVLWGAAEGRNPSPLFDGDIYRKQNPSIVAFGINPLWHYLCLGRQAGLAIFPARIDEIPKLPVSDENYRRWAARPPAAPRRDSNADILLLPERGLPRTGGADGILFVPDGATPARDALLEFRLAAEQHPEAAMFYADEEWDCPHGCPQAPWFKPDWDPELMRAGDLTGPVTLFRHRLLEQLGWNGLPMNAAQLRDFALRAAPANGQIVHIAKVLSRRAGPASSPLVPVRTVCPDPAPLVSVIIPTCDRFRLLRQAASGLLERTDYPAIELIIVDNASRDPRTYRLFRQLLRDERVRLVTVEGAFNWSRMNNQAARVASGDILLLLNNDIEIVARDWLSRMVAHAVRPDVGAVGAKLLYPGGTIQHAGISLSSEGIAHHVLRNAAADAAGPHGVFGVARSVAAVTGACLAVRREVFDQVGGLEQDHLPVTNNDVDFCLRLRAAGYRVVYEPAAVLTHHEAATRGADRRPAQQDRVRAELRYLRSTWGDLALSDPYLSKNLCIVRNRFAFVSRTET